MNSGQSKSSSNSHSETLRKIPKVELHRHLECSLRLSTFIELATDLGMEIPLTKEEIENEFLVTSPMLDLESVLKKFLRTQAVLHSEEILARITFEAIEDAVQEGIRILELRWAPTYVQQGHSNLNFEKIIRAVRSGAQMAQNLPIAVGFLSIIQRNLPVPEADNIVDFTLEHKDFFVGMDLADNEVGFDPRLFEKAFLRARKSGLQITVHAGEADVPEASLNIKNSIEYLGAQRIGHGVQIYKDPFVMNLIRANSIPLELCLTSNWLTQAVSSLTTHPIRQLFDAKLPVTINSDDPGIFGIDLVHEYELLARHYGFQESEFQHCNDVAAQASFIPLIKRQKYWPRPIHKIK
jgi:adenosine deaminase